MEWQPIETAPKDGTRILLCVAGAENPAVGYWRADRGVWDYIDEEDMPSEEAWEEYLADFMEWPCTHWAPIPPVPRITDG